LQIQCYATKYFDCHYGLAAKATGIRKKLNGLGEEVGTWWSWRLTLPLDEGLPESQYQKEVYIPQALFPYTSLIVWIEGLQVRHKLVFVKEMDKLSTVEFYSIEQKDGIVDTRYNQTVGVRNTTCAVPEEFVRWTIKQQFGARQGRFPDVLMH
jgi:hypothetical protein